MVLLMDGGKSKGRLAIIFFVSFTGSCCDSWVDIQCKMHLSFKKNVIFSPLSQIRHGCFISYFVSLVLMKGIWHIEIVSSQGLNNPLKIQ